MAAVMEAKEAQAPVTKPVQTMKLRHNRMERAEVQRTQWLVTCEPNTKPEDLLNPAYWAHVAIKFNPRDVLEVWAEDGEWYAECMVRATDRTWAKVHIIDPLMAAIVSLGDLTAITLFGSQGFVTLPSLIYRQMGSYRMETAAGTALVLAVFTLSLVTLAERWSSRND